MAAWDRPGSDAPEQATEKAGSERTNETNREADIDNPEAAQSAMARSIANWVREVRTEAHENELQAVDDHLWDRLSPYLEHPRDTRQGAHWEIIGPDEGRFKEEQEKKAAGQPYKEIVAYYDPDQDKVFLRSDRSNTEQLVDYAHERIHQMANQPLEWDLETGQIVRRGGFRIDTYADDNKHLGTKNMGLNEATTEMLTLRQMNEMGIPSAEIAYQPGINVVEYLQQGMGADAFRRAYFGGQPEQVAELFNATMKNDAAFDSLSKLMDQSMKMKTDGVDIPDELWQPEWGAKHRITEPAEAQQKAETLAILFAQVRIIAHHPEWREER